MTIVSLKAEDSVCRWKGCRKSTQPGAWFCSEHMLLAATKPQGTDRFKWARDLSYVVSTGLATSAVYDVLKSLVEHAHVVGLSDPIQERIGYILDEPDANAGWSIQQYVDLSADQHFVDAVSQLTTSSFKGMRSQLPDTFFPR